MNLPGTAFALLCFLPMLSTAATVTPPSNTSNQVSRQADNYAGLDQAEFETRLQSKFAGTFAIYKGLADYEKTEIYQAAASGTDVSKLRSMILRNARKR